MIRWLLGIGLALLALGALVPARRYAHGGDVSAEDMQRLQLTRLTHEGHRYAYQRYQLMCPSLERLADEVDRGTEDVWGRPLLYGCSVTGDRLTLMVTSSGPDREVGTEDDLREVLRYPDGR